MIDTNGQTPLWAAELIWERYYSDMAPGAVLLDPTCGWGAMLRAVPPEIAAFGVEINPSLAERARRTSGRDVVTGDILSVDLPRMPTDIIGNPPFIMPLVEGILGRAEQWLPEGGRCGLILPASAFQTPNTVMRLHRAWSITQEMLPRTIFHRLRTHICFAVFRKEPLRRLVGFALYGEAIGVKSLPEPVQALLINGERPTWRSLVEWALRRLGGAAPLHEIYAESSRSAARPASCCASRAAMLKSTTISTIWR